MGRYRWDADFKDFEDRSEQRAVKTPYGWVWKSPSKTEKLSKATLGLDDYLLRLMRDLPHEKIQIFLYHYEQEYGLPAAKYAENKFFEWAYGNLMPQTRERIIHITRFVLTASEKMEIAKTWYKKIRENYKKPPTALFLIYIDDPGSTLRDIENFMVHSLNSFKNPPALGTLLTKIRWLMEKEPEALL